MTSEDELREREHERELVIGGEPWLARLTGQGAAGSGALGLGMMEAIEFARVSAPAQPVREVLVQRGRFSHLFDAELVSLFATARIVNNES
jgi:hypothetical protein